MKEQRVHTNDCELSKSVESIDDTSSTAQGGGGSFKDRKPIGDVHGWDSKKTV